MRKNEKSAVAPRTNYVGKKSVWSFETDLSKLCEKKIEMSAAAPRTDYVGKKGLN